MTIRLHHAPSTRDLAVALGEVLATPLDDPFAEEVVVVPAKGVERWLTQRLSHRLGAGERGGDGVCAGVRFLHPRSLIGLLTGVDRDDPWLPDRLAWSVLAVIDDSLGEPWCAALARHLGHGAADRRAEIAGERRYSVARRIAGLLAQYAVQRPTMTADWAEGRDTDGVGGPLPADLRWQAELWRRLIPRVDAPTPAERHQDTVAAIRGGADLALPGRLSLFGHTRLPVSELELLRAVGEVREVHLWLPQASPVAWAALREEVAVGPVPRREDGSALTVRHPLLSSLGRDGRELQRSLTLLGPLESVEEGATGAASGETLLSWLQHDLRHDAPPERPSRRLAADDRSVQVHACHGLARQVEVLRDVLAGLMEDDPTLEPRDVLVMCPDVETVAPLFSAAFGLAGVQGTEGLAHPAHRLRVRVADRGLVGTNALLSLAAGLLRIAGGRATASEVLDLAGSAPVRTRFGFDDDELAQLATWTADSGVRWGLCADLRASYRLEAFGNNTWEAGLDRVLLGVAVAERGGDDSPLQGLVGRCLPLDDVGSASIDLAGRFAEFVARVEAGVRDLRSAVTLSEWVAAVRDSALSLGAVPARDAWQLSQFEREIDGLLDTGGRDPRLTLGDVRALLEQRLAPRPTRANFRTGALTVSTMVPMRSVPHRVVCLVGLDDGVFPRSTISDGDDVLARDPVTGERDLRSEDRQLLLDALLATGETLVVTYTAANEHSGQPRPPAVPLGELLDALDATAVTADGGPARDQIVTHHPLQPFDARNLTPGLVGPHPFSFDRAALASATAAQGPRSPRPRLAEAELRPRRPADVTLQELQQFFAHPVRAFLAQRLDVAVPHDVDDPRDALPVELDHLETWTIGDRILSAALAGESPDRVFLAELHRGSLPPDGLGERAIKQVTRQVHALYAASATARAVADPRDVDVTVDLGGGRRLTGVVPDVRASRIVRVHYGRLSGKHRLASWIDLLALSAGLPDHSWTALTMGWHSSNSPQQSLQGPLDHRAVDLLRDLVELRDRGLASCLVLPPKTTYAFADAHRAGRSSYGAARGAWESGRFPGECDDPALVRLLGRGAAFDELLAPAGAHERWHAGERSRLGQYALRIWGPVFDHEQVGPA